MHTIAYALTSYGLWILAPLVWKLVSYVFAKLQKRGF